MSDFFSKLLTRLLVLLSLAAPMDAPEPDWTTIPPAVNYVTKMQFRSRTQETFTTDSPTLPGWTLQSENVGEWSEWISNGTQPVVPGDDCEVQPVYFAYADPPYTEYIYRTRSRSYTFSRWSYWSGWQDGFILETPGREVQSRTLYAVDESLLPSALHIRELTTVPMLPGTGCQLQYLPGVSTLLWRSTNPAVVSVNGHGYLSAHQTGASRIIATTQSGRHVASFTVIVGLWEDGRFPEALHYLPSEIFSGSDLCYVNLRDSAVTGIGSRAFADCEELRLVLAGSRPIDVAYDAFSGCERLIIACTDEGSVSRYAQDYAIPYYMIGDPDPWRMITSLDLSVKNTALQPGESFALSASILPTDASCPALLWSSSNSASVCVSSDGYVTALAPGYAIITARTQDGSALYDNCMVTVLDDESGGLHPALPVTTASPLFPVQPLHGL